MLETIREYAVEQLDLSGERDGVVGRHADYFLALAEEAEPHLVEETATGWLDRLEVEHDNLRAALARFDGAGEGEQLHRLAGALADFWQVRGPLVEGTRWLERALAADARPSAARAKTLVGAAELSSFGGAPGETVRTFAQEALILYEDLSDRLGIARCNAALGYACSELHQWEDAQRFAEESVRGLEAVGAEHRALWATRTLAHITLSLGQIDRARQLHEANLLRTRTLGNRRVEATTLGALAMLVVDEEGRHREAISLLTENMPIFEQLGDEIDIETNLCRIAFALALAGDAVVAAKLLAQAEGSFRELGVSQPWLTRNNDQALKLVRLRLDDTAFDAARAEGAVLSTEDAIALAMTALAAASNDASQPLATDPSA